MHTVIIQNYFVGTTYTISTPLSLFEFKQEAIAAGGVFTSATEFLPLAYCGLMDWTSSRLLSGRACVRIAPGSPLCAWSSDGTSTGIRIRRPQVRVLSCAPL